MAARRRLASLPTNACRSCHASFSEGRRDRSNRRSPNRDRSSTATKRRRGRPRSAPIQPLLRRSARAPAPGMRAAAAKRRLISRSGGIIPVAVARPKRQAVRLSTGSHSIVDRAAVPRRRRRLSGQAPGRSRRSVHGGARGRSAPRRFPARRQATRTSPGPARGCSRHTCGFRPASGHKRRRIGIGERALHRDLNHLGREAVGIDAGDQHPRRVGFAHAQQQPGAFGDPVDRIDVARRARPWRAARRAARYAPSARRSACPSAASGSTGTRRWRRPTGSAPRPSSAGSRLPTIHGSRRAQPGYSTGGGGGGRLRLATSSTALSSAPVARDRRRTRWRRRLRRAPMPPCGYVGRRRRRLLAAPACCASAGSATATAADAISRMA